MYMFASTYSYTSKFQATILYTSNGASLQKLDSSPFLVNHIVTVPYYVRQAETMKQKGIISIHSLEPQLCYLSDFIATVLLQAPFPSHHCYTSKYTIPYIVRQAGREHEIKRKGIISNHSLEVLIY